jgi:hypothetical protein
MNRYPLALMIAAVTAPLPAAADCFASDPRLIGMQPGPGGDVSILYRAEVDTDDGGVTVSGNAQVYFYVMTMTGSVMQSSSLVPVMARARRGQSRVDILLSVYSPLGRITQVDDVDFANVQCS